MYCADVGTDEFLQPSDEEVLAYSELEDDDEEEEEDESNLDGELSGPKPTGRAAAGSEDEDEAAEGEELGGWGPSKQDYYNADVIETEQDALNEEAEARRIQQKQLQSMTAADYGFDENEWQDGGAGEEAEAEHQGVVTEILPPLQVTEQMGVVERLKLLKTRYPEFEPLSKEFLDLQKRHEELFGAAATEGRLSASATSPDSPIPAIVTKHRAAAAYLASLTMYFALLTSTANDSQSNGIALSAATIRDHPVMDSLVQCRALWNKVKDFPVEDQADLAVEEYTSAIEAPAEEFASGSEVDDTEKQVAQGATQKKSRAERAAAAVDAEAETRRAKRMRQAEAGFADLDALVTGAAPKRSSKTKKAAAIAPVEDDSDFGEETELNAFDAAEKARRKKSLRFYTSQIAQKANKRGAAGRNAGGDDDIPYRERLKDRQARLNAEAEKRGKNATRDVLGEESDEEDRRQARAIRDEGSDEEYYDMVAAQTAKEKADKKALADAYKEATAQGGRVVETEEVGPDGKRAISYAIEKNKGLTPHRKKDVRNPRVKKRKKFEEKKKKLASQRPVYKGGEGRGGYGGELTGIKKGLVRSTKL